MLYCTIYAALYLKVRSYYDAWCKRYVNQLSQEQIFDQLKIKLIDFKKRNVKKCTLNRAREHIKSLQNLAGSQASCKEASLCTRSQSLKVCKRYDEREGQSQ